MIATTIKPKQGKINIQIGVGTSRISRHRTPALIYGKLAVSPAWSQTEQKFRRDDAYTVTHTTTGFCFGGPWTKAVAIQIAELCVDQDWNFRTPSKCPKATIDACTRILSEFRSQRVL